jgi:hypothetical protein
MSDRSRYIKAFSSTLEQFIAQLMIAFPEEKKLPSGSRLVSSMIRTNPTLVVKSFTRYVMPYADAIRRRDETFFKSRDFPEVEEASGNLMDSMRLTELWDVMSPQTQVVTWQYMQLLVAATERINA